MNLSAIAAAVLTPLILRFLLKSAPLKGSPDDFPDLAQLEKKWNKVYIISGFLSLLVIALGIYLVWLLMVLIADHVADEVVPGSIVYKLDNISLILPALFSGIFAGALIMILLERLLLDNAQRREFICFQNIKSGGDMRIILSRMAMVIVPASLLLFVYMTDQYAIFTQENIRINTFSHMNENVYSYNQVRRISSGIIIDKDSATGKETGRQHEVTVLFDDGIEWSSSSGGKTLDASEEKNQELLQLLNRITGLSIVTKPTKTVWKN